MRAAGWRMVAPILAALALAGCQGDPQLMNLSAGQNSPDEFAVLPTKPLTMPQDLAVLPAPTTGGTNITDPTPLPDAVAALGGNPAQLSAEGVGAADGALVSYAARGGVNPGIRQDLAEADVEYRSRKARRPFEILARTSVYMRAYRPMILDSDAELDRWRRAGARTPSAPPRGVE